MAKTNPAEFIQEVRDEAKKITWPSRKEVMISTIMVMIMVTAASMFFLLVDFVLKQGIDKLLLGL
ncbi:MAG: preprotein translocase subunit SecE [Aestuariivirga sp.]|jgi:preprotein translocase subunit SecE